MRSPQQLKKDVEMLQRVLNVEPSEEQKKADELIGLLRNREEYVELVKGLSLEEQKKVAGEINDYYDHVELEPMLEPYRESFRTADLKNSGLYHHHSESDIL